MLNSASRFTGLGLAALFGGVVVVSACDSGGDDGDARGGSNSGGSSAGMTTGGTPGAGTTGAGTSNAGTTSAGTGGSTAQVVTECPGVVPMGPAIADFEMAPAAGGKYEWGSTEQGTTDFWGGTFNYPVGLELTFVDGAMTAAGNVTEYAGFGLYVQNCADASSFQGVRFKIKGNPPANEPIRFAVQTNKNEWATGTKGSCLAPDAQKFINCVHPSVVVADVTDADFITVDVTWADLGMGKPAADATTDGADVIGLQWIIPWAEKHAAYDISVTIDDVELIG